MAPFPSCGLVLRVQSLSCAVLAATWLFGPAALCADQPAQATPREPVISEAKQDANGLAVHGVRSPYQAGQTLIKILQPDRPPPGKSLRTLYVLPVEVGEDIYWGDGLLEVKRQDLHNRFELLCVFPTFSHLPWYADHPSDPQIRQESYLLKVVLPFVERCYPAKTEPDGRLLLGFSKSGWGAFSLLLRHPDVFGRAAAWDAPLMESRPVPYGMGPIFGSQENFEQYRISTLIRRRAAEMPQGALWSKRPRLVLLGYDNFRQHHVGVHQLLDELKIPHVYRDGPQRKHHWESGWLAEAVECLVAP